MRINVKTVFPPLGHMPCGVTCDSAVVDLLSKTKNSNNTIRQQYPALIFVYATVLIALTMVRPRRKDVCPLRVSGFSSSAPQACFVYPCKRNKINNNNNNNKTHRTCRCVTKNSVAWPALHTQSIVSFPLPVCTS